MSQQSQNPNPWVALWRTTVSGVVSLSAIFATAVAVIGVLPVGPGGLEISLGELRISRSAPPPAPVVPRMEEAPAPSPAPRYLGLRIEGIRPESAFSLNVPEPHGVLVHWVLRGSPADRADIRRGDILTHADGIRLVDGNDLIRVVRRTPVGSRVMLDGYRMDTGSPLPLHFEVEPAEIAGWGSYRND